VEKDVSGFSVRRSTEAARRFKAAGHWRDTTLVDIARLRTDEDPSRNLLIEGEQRLSRGEAWQQASRLAGYFLERGLTPGDVVAFQLPNWIESAVIALAARMCGLVINPIPPNYRESETRYILHDCGAKLAFVPGMFRGFDHLGMMQRLSQQLPNLRDVVVVRGGSKQKARWEEALSTPPASAHELPRVDAAAVMMVMYTSGTTSHPKGVLHSHQTYDYKVRQMGEVWGITERDIVFMPSPVTHITGAFWSFDMPWVSGCSSVLLDVWSAQQGILLIQQHRCTVSGGATPFLQQLLDIAGERNRELASLRIFFCGGTTVSPELIRKAGLTFPECLFFRAYGCTEMPTISMGIRTREQARLGAETDGEVLLPMEVRITAPDGEQAVPDGEEGEILARGPEQFLGYLHAEDNENSFDNQGYFRTGDLGSRVNGNYLVITGRKKDIIIRSGENISPKEVEDALLRHPAIADVAIVAMPSPNTGEKGCAFVIPRDDATVDLASIRAFLEGSGLARQKFPEHLVIVSDLPRVPSGKVRKDVLRAEARKIAAELTPDQAANTF
jgi:acyl-CoA synthetase (AMP-forming)/AMP-acid ligase II